MPAKAFSISSIHKTHGLTVSESFKARRILPSDSPTYLPMRRPTSRRIKGTRVAVALVARLLPQPGIPRIKMSLGTSTPNLIALSREEKILAFLSSQLFNLSRPPMSSIVFLKFIISRMPDFLITCSFSLRINFLSEASSRPLP